VAQGAGEDERRVGNISQRGVRTRFRRAVVEGTQRSALEESRIGKHAKCERVYNQGKKKNTEYETFVLGRYKRFRPTLGTSVQRSKTSRRGTQKKEGTKRIRREEGKTLAGKIRTAGRATKGYELEGTRQRIMVGAETTKKVDTRKIDMEKSYSLSGGKPAERGGKPIAGIRVHVGRDYNIVARWVARNGEWEQKTH